MVEPTVGDGVYVLVAKGLQPVMAVASASAKAVEVAVFRGERINWFPNVRCGFGLQYRARAALIGSS